MKTYSAKLSEIQRKWYLIDAQDLVLGRLASIIAAKLRGKHKPTYSPNLDCGDHVIVINAEKIFITGKKRENKKFFWHTGFPGGIKETTPRKTLESKNPERVIERAVERMLPRNNMGRHQLTKMHLYVGSEHPHEAQKPEKLDVAALNEKNKKRTA
ncbi:MAG: 50S ribosomal protein L13 [Proteobacteria bacterium]|nr:50S ribosomal protein L13 [Pseudomonadota bacterium]